MCLCSLEGFEDRIESIHHSSREAHCKPAHRYSGLGVRHDRLMVRADAAPESCIPPSGLQCLVDDKFLSTINPQGVFMLVQTLPPRLCLVTTVVSIIMIYFELCQVEEMLVACWMHSPSVSECTAISVELISESSTTSHLVSPAPRCL